MSVYIQPLPTKKEVLMKRVLTISVLLIALIGFVTVNASAQFKYDDKIGVVKIKKGDPIHIATWFVVAGPDASLGTDTQRGVEIALDDKGGKVLGHPVKISVQDTGCNAEGGQAAATKLASDPTMWRP
jgi:branched-chain amino acid transport system substrate-binding protein